MPQLHILVIEDDHATSEYVSLLLTMHGYHVRQWFTSTQAVEQVVEQQPDLVVLDHRFGAPPDGWMVVQTLHGLSATAHIPVILYSAEHNLLDSYQVELRAMGGDVLLKPFAPNDLLVKIETLTTSQQ